MTRKEHLLKLIPDIEYDLRLEKLNLILEAMENHTEEQLQLAAVSHRRELLAAFQRDYNKRNFEDSQIADQDIELFLAANCG